MSQATDQSPIIYRQRFSHEQLQLLNMRCLDIVQKAKNNDEQNENKMFFNQLEWEGKKTIRYSINPQMEEARAQINQSKNQLMRQFEHSTYKRRLKKQYKMNGQDVPYMEQFVRIQPDLNRIRILQQVETTQTSQIEKVAIDKYPDLKNRPRLASYLHSQTQSRRLSIQQRYKLQEIHKKSQKQNDHCIPGFIMPCNLIPIKSSSKTFEQPPMKISQIIQTCYKNKYIRKNSAQNSSRSRQGRSQQYKKLHDQQYKILQQANKSLSKQTRQKLSQSLNRIVILTIPRKTSLPSFTKTIENNTFKFPTMQTLIKKRKK